MQLNAMSKKRFSSFGTALKKLSSMFTYSLSELADAISDELSMRVPSYHLVELNSNGSVKSKSSTLTYAVVHSNLTNPLKSDYLDILWENGSGSNQFTRFHAKCIGVMEVTSGSLIFVGTMYYGNSQMTLLFALDDSDTLTTIGILPTPESLVNKVQSVAAHSTDLLTYPSTKAVFDEFQRKPVTVWEHTDGGTKVKALNSNISAAPSWQITGLDLSAYKRLKFYVTPGVSSNNIAPCAIVELSLDSDASNNDTHGHYAGGSIYQYLNNDNRLYVVSFCVSADKTSVCFLRQTSLYGTGGTSAVDDSRYLYKIEGYYD